ncbi:MAG: SDR family NAD(P)-dependent oxidoreductase [Candidatus Atribacteria bacterium]|nr:SDR family NAD(P)-dependent oxidoreductase [Candidatus Atribacteria bacterium]
MRLKNKIALVTGGGQGIGSGIAMKLAQEGVYVIVNDIHYENAQQIIEKIKQFKGNGVPYQADVTKSDEVEEMEKFVSKEIGDIDILVNNAGICKFAPFLETTEEVWDKIIQANLKSSFLCCQYFLPGMIKKRGGKIVNISSESGKRGSKGQSAYCASKFGVIGLTQVLALEFAPFNINVNAVCPGPIDTPLWEEMKTEFSVLYGLNVANYKDYFVKNYPISRMGTIEDVANGVLFLVLPESDYITGQSININGGAVFY